MRRTTALIAAPLVGLAMLTPPTAATAAGETCHGEAATIVGARGLVIIGTEGRDVVVTNASPRVSTLGGDDLICITGPAAKGGSYGVDVDAGPGDDVVDGTAADSWEADVTLGRGADRFEGGRAEDTVEAGFSDTDDNHLDTDVDVLIAGGGRDYFTSGQDGEPNGDVIQGGEGPDSIFFHGEFMSDAAVIDGQAGIDRLHLVLPAGETSVDNVTGEARNEGVVVRRWSGIENFGLGALDSVSASVSFTGSDVDEYVWVLGLARVVADLGAGDDRLEMREVLAANSSIAGGAGRDYLTMGSQSRDISWDLRRGVMQVGHDWTVPATGFEDAYVAAPAVELLGTDGPNHLSFTSCEGKLVGRNGRDTLVQGSDTVFEEFTSCADRAVMLGGGGHDSLLSTGGADDRMVGGRGNDVFDARGGRDVVFGGPGNDRADLGNGSDVFWGGPGRDQVDGGPGTDLCRSERRTRCER